MRGRAGRPGRMPSWWGSLTGRAGVCIVAAGAALGALFTVLAGTGPGPVLSVFLLAGTLAAAFAVQPRAVYRIIPGPALAYVLAAAAAGLIGDREASTSHTALVLSAAQWIASGFLAMSAATLLAIVVTGARWLASRPGPEDPGYSRGGVSGGPVYFPAGRRAAAGTRTQPVRNSTVSRRTTRGG